MPRRAVSHAVALQVGGGTLWEFAPLALVPELEVGRLGRQASSTTPAALSAALPAAAPAAAPAALLALASPNPNASADRPRC